MGLVHRGMKAVSFGLLVFRGWDLGHLLFLERLFSDQHQPMIWAIWCLGFELYGLAFRCAF